MSKKPRGSARQHGFTLIELLVVVAIIALLLSILLPSLSNAKEQAREAVCKANLHGFGRGFHVYAGNNSGHYCSGSMDPGPERDGPVDKIGWVADLVNTRTAQPAKALCPSNPARFNQKLNEVKATLGEPIMRELIQKGYNTNYTQSWYMARSQWRPESNNYNFKRVASTLGALNENKLTRMSPSIVPFMGDGRTDNDEPLIDGKRVVKTMTDGPFGGPYGIQNYADFGPAHGFGSLIQRSKKHNRVRANLLFADGHVEAFSDKDRDGEFALDNTRTPPDQKDLGRKVFDGVLTLGRRSDDAWAMK